MANKFPEVVHRIKNDTGLITRILLASAITYLLINYVFMRRSDLTGVLAAILAVQTSVSETFKQAAERIIAIILGVGLAILVSDHGGLNIYTLLFVLGTSLLISSALNFKVNKLEIPISSLLILGVSQVEMASEDRILNSLIGMVSGIVVSIIIPPHIRNEEAVTAVTDIADDTADIIENYAIAMHNDATMLDSSEYVSKIHQVLPKIIDASETVKEAEDENKFNPRAYITPQIVETLQQSISTLDTCVVSLREIMVNMYQQNQYEWSDEQLRELTDTVSTILYDISRSIRMYGDYTLAVTEKREEDAEERLQEMLVALRETQAVAAKRLFNDDNMSNNLVALRFTVLESVNTIINVLSPEQIPAPKLVVREHIREVKKTKPVRVAARVKRKITTYRKS